MLVSVFWSEKNEEVSEAIREFLKRAGFKKSRRKNLFRGGFGLGLIGKGLKGLDAYTDSIQHAESNDGVEVDIFTGTHKIFMMVRFNEDTEKQVLDALEMFLED